MGWLHFIVFEPSGSSQTADYLNYLILIPSYRIIPVASLSEKKLEALLHEHGFI
jgi:hypothetical protein